MTEPVGDLVEAVNAAKDATTFAELAAALRLLRVSCGEPSFQSLEKVAKANRAPVSVASMSEKLKPENPKKLTYNFVSNFTRALQVDPSVTKVFEQEWQRLRKKQVQQDTGPEAVVPDQRVGEPVGVAITAEHMRTLDYFAHLADEASGDLGLAQAIHEHIYDVCRRLLGEDAERTEVAARDLGIVLLERGDYPRARGFLWHVHEAAKKRHGDEHPETLTAAENLAALHLHTERYEEAIRLARRCLTSRRRQNAELDSMEYVTDLLIQAFEKNGQHAEAEAVRHRHQADLEQRDGGSPD